jgi:predicted nucleotidyltransferase
MESKQVDRKEVLKQCKIKFDEEQRLVNQKIKAIFGVEAVNVGSIALGIWHENSDLDLACGYTTEEEHERLLKAAIGAKLKERGSHGVNRVFTFGAVDIQIRPQQEIDWILAGGARAMKEYNPDKHIELLEKIEAGGKDKQLKLNYYKKFIPQLKW